MPAFLSPFDCFRLLDGSNGQATGLGSMPRQAWNDGQPPMVASPSPASSITRVQVASGIKPTISMQSIDFKPAQACSPKYPRPVAALRLIGFRSPSALVAMGEETVCRQFRECFSDFFRKPYDSELEQRKALTSATNIPTVAITVQTGPVTH